MFQLPLPDGALPSGGSPGGHNREHIAGNCKKNTYLKHNVFAALANERAGAWEGEMRSGMKKDLWE